MRFAETFQVATNHETAFTYAADFRNLPEWDSSVRAVEMLTSGPIGRDSRFRVTLTFLGMPAVLDYTVIEWDAPSRAVLRAENAISTAIDEIRVRADGTGAQVEWHADISFAFPISLLDWILAAAFSSSVRAAVAGLRERIAAQPNARLDAKLLKR